MVLGAGRLAAILRVLHPGVGDSSLDARLKYFQRTPFPDERVAVGRGWRAGYGPADLQKMIWAFELLVRFVPPTQAMQLIREGWGELEWSLASAWGARGPHAHAQPVLVGGAGVVGKEGSAGSIRAATTDQLRKWLQGSGDLRSMLVIDAARMALALDDALGEVLSSHEAEEFRGDMSRWVDEVRSRSAARKAEA